MYIESQCTEVGVNVTPSSGLKLTQKENLATAMTAKGKSLAAQVTWVTDADRSIDAPGTCSRRATCVHTPPSLHLC